MGSESEFFHGLGSRKRPYAFLFKRVPFDPVAMMHTFHSDHAHILSARKRRLAAQLGGSAGRKSSGVFFSDHRGPSLSGILFSMQVSVVFFEVRPFTPSLPDFRAVARENAASFALAPLLRIREGGSIDGARWQGTPPEIFDEGALTAKNLGKRRRPEATGSAGFRRFGFGRSGNFRRGWGNSVRSW